MSSLMDFLLAQPSAQDRYMQVQSLMGSPGGGGGMGGGNVDDFSSDAQVGDVLLPGDPLLDSRRGVTLQQAALQSLLDIARASGVMPGTRELKSITDSYRSPAQQAAAYANKPGLAAPPGKSLHQQGLAIDWGWAAQHPEIVQLLEQAGWHRFDPQKEPWHWSFGTVG